jgi:hypothetical protein
MSISITDLSGLDFMGVSGVFGYFLGYCMIVPRILWTLPPCVVSVPRPFIYPETRSQPKAPQGSNFFKD